MAILECKNLSKSFGTLKALDDVNISIEPGKIVGLLGPNGSGKTTLIKLAKVHAFMAYINFLAFIPGALLYLTTTIGLKRNLNLE